jgi:hypothetical protein
MNRQLDTMPKPTSTAHPAEVADTARLEGHIRRLARPCGCKSGAALTLLALIGWPVKVILAGLPHTLSGIAVAVVLYPVVVLAAALIGKVAGIIVGRARRRWYQRRLRTLRSSAARPSRG